MKKFKIATIGCSHSSYFAGIPWPIPLAEKLGGEVKMAYSAGAGNEMNIQKLNHLLNENKLDLVIVQLTDPYRLVLGIDYKSFNADLYYDDLTGTHNIKDVTYYTFNHTKNVDNLEKHLKKSFHNDVDNLIINHIITSEYNLYHKVVHTICAMESLARVYNTPIVFFSWCVDMEKLFNENGYSKVLENFNIIPSYVEEFAANNGLRRTPPGHPGGGHYATEEQVRIANEYVLPYLISNNFVKPNLTKSTDVL